MVYLKLGSSYQYLLGNDECKVRLLIRLGREGGNNLRRGRVYQMWAGHIYFIKVIHFYQSDIFLGEVFQNNEGGIKKSVRMLTWGYACVGEGIHFENKDSNLAPHPS